MHEVIFIRNLSGIFMRVDSRGIILVEASGGCARIITVGERYLVNSSLSQLEEILPAAHFCRVNRSCLLGMEHVKGFNVELIFIMDREVALGKAYAKGFLERVKVVL